MGSLIDEVPEARAFCEEVRKNVATHKLFAGEEFAQMTDAVLSTTGTDSQGHAFEVQHLEEFADQINYGTQWGGLRHDPRIHPISRALAARVFYSPKSKKHFLAAVLGYYDAEKLPSFSDLGVDLSGLPRPETTELPRHPTGPYAKLALNPYEIDIATFEHVLADAPDIVNSRIEGRFRKAAELPQIVTVAASLWLLANTPFGKKFLERYGEEAAEQSLKFFRWLKGKVVAAVAGLRGPNAMLVIESPYHDCRLEFIIASSEPDVLLDAISGFRSAAASAISLAGALSQFQVLRVVYEYDKENKRWLPLYATTVERGIIAQRPFLITAQELSRMGLSIGGAAPAVGQRKGTLGKNAGGDRPTMGAG